MKNTAVQAGQQPTTLIRYLDCPRLARKVRKKSLVDMHPALSSATVDSCNQKVLSAAFDDLAYWRYIEPHIADIQLTVMLRFIATIFAKPERPLFGATGKLCFRYSRRCGARWLRC